MRTEHGRSHQTVSLPETGERLKQTPLEIVYAGGTISSLATADGYREGGHKIDLIEQLNQARPDAIQGAHITGADFAYLGLSENMDHGYWNSIVQKIEAALSRNPQAVIITHGTDSMEQTARHLEAIFADRLTVQQATLILTGANYDIAHPATDAWENLQFALASGQSGQEPGVYIAFHGQLIPAQEVVKEPFNGTEMHYTSSKSPEYAEAREKQRQRDAACIQKLVATLGDRPSLPSAVKEYPVNVVCENHDDFLASLGPETRAVLLTLYHSGTANTENPISSVAQLVEELRNRNIVTFGVTENGEPVDLHLYETSVKLRSAGVVPLYDMTQAVAAKKLSYCAQEAPEAMITLMLENLVGEREMPTHSEDIQALIELYASDID